MIDYLYSAQRAKSWLHPSSREFRLITPTSRMLRSAQNFATGFFGYPADEQYNLEVMVESPGFNCTLAPWNTVCRPKSSGDDLTSSRSVRRSTVRYGLS